MTLPKRLDQQVRLINVPYETLKVRDNIHLLKHNNNQLACDVLNTEGDVEKVQSAQGGKGTSESLGREG